MLSKNGILCGIHRSIFDESGYNISWRKSSLARTLTTSQWSTSLGFPSVWISGSLFVSDRNRESTTNILNSSFGIGVSLPNFLQMPYIFNTFRNASSSAFDSKI